MEYGQTTALGHGSAAVVPRIGVKLGVDDGVVRVAAGQLEARADGPLVGEREGPREVQDVGLVLPEQQPRLVGSPPPLGAGQRIAEPAVNPVAELLTDHHLEPEGATRQTGLEQGLVEGVVTLIALQHVLVVVVEALERDLPPLGRLDLHAQAGLIGRNRGHRRVSEGLGGHHRVRRLVGDGGHGLQRHHVVDLDAGGQLGVHGDDRVTTVVLDGEPRARHQTEPSDRFEVEVQKGRYAGEVVAEREGVERDLRFGAGHLAEHVRDVDAQVGVQLAVEGIDTDVEAQHLAGLEPHDGAQLHEPVGDADAQRVGVLGDLGRVGVEPLEDGRVLPAHRLARDVVERCADTVETDPEGGRPGEAQLVLGAHDVEAPAQFGRDVVANPGLVIGVRKDDAVERFVHLGGDG